jgi:hypothetical protein
MPSRYSTYGTITALFARFSFGLGVTMAGFFFGACSSSSSDSPISAEASDDGSLVDGSLADGTADGSGQPPPDASPVVDAGMDVDAALEAATDADVCASPQVLRYESAGCGADALPVCGRADQDACAIEVCGCDGQTIVKCDYASAPWAHIGSCSDAADP